MLILIRSKIGSIVVKFFAFLLILGFGAWGIQDMLGYQVGGGGAVAEVGDEKLEGRVIYREVYNEINRFRRLFGPNFNIDQARQMGLIDNVLERQINATATLVGAAELGVTISDGQIRQAIMTEPMFRGLAGNFDRTRFAEILHSNGLSEEAYVNSLRRELAATQFIGSIGAGVVAPGKWVDAVFRHREEKRTVETALVADAGVADVGAPRDEDLRTFYNENEQTFTAPEYRAVTYLRLDAADLAGEMEVSDEELRESYEARADEFTTQGKRQVQQILFADEAKAKAAAAALKTGQDFATVAKEIAGMAAANTDLGEITEGDLLPEVSGPVFEMAAESVSAPLKSSLGWHIFRVGTVTPGGIKTFEEARDQVKADFAREKAVDALFDLSNKLEDVLGGGATIEEAAASLDLKVVKLDAVDRTGKNAAGTAVENLPGGQGFLATAFETAEGEDSQLGESGDDGFYVLRVDKITAPALRPFETITDQIRAAWEAEKRREAAQALATTLTAFVNSGKTLAGAVQDYGLEVTEIKDVARSGRTPEGLNAALVEKIFTLAPAHAAMERVDEGVRIAVLKSVTAADAAADKKAREALAGNLVEAVQADLDVQLAAALRDQAGVDVNRRAVDALFGDQQQQ